MSRYDSYFHIRELVRRKLKNMEFRALPETKLETFFDTYGHLRFIDSLDLLNPALAKLAQTLEDSDFE